MPKGVYTPPRTHARIIDSSLTWNIHALIVAIDAYNRITWKGYAPDIPNQLQDEQGTLWVSTCDFAKRAINLYARRHFYSNDKPKSTESWRFTVEEFGEMIANMPLKQPE